MPKGAAAGQVLREVKHPVIKQHRAVLLALCDFKEQDDHQYNQGKKTDGVNEIHSYLLLIPDIYSCYLRHAIYARALYYIVYGKKHEL